MKIIAKCLLAACVPLAVASCSTVPRPPARSGDSAQAAAVPANYRELAVIPGGRVFALDPAASRIRIYAFRGGKAAFAGHNHVLTATVFSGSVYVPPKKMAEAQFDLNFPLDQLVVDDPKLRAETGGAFTTALDADAVSGTREHMLGPKNLDAAHYPDVAIHSVAIAGELPRLVATVAVSLHGQTHRQLVPLTVTVDGEVLLVTGAFALRQTDFGVTPYSVLGELLAVQDEVAIDFTLVARPASFAAAP